MPFYETTYLWQSDRISCSASFRLKLPVQLEEITSDGFDRNVPRGEEGGAGGGGGHREREYRNTEYGNFIQYGHSPVWRGVSSIIHLFEYNAHSTQVADVGMLQTEAKPYVQENSYDNSPWVRLLKPSPPPPPTPHSPGDFLRQWFLDSSVCGLFNICLSTRWTILLLGIIWDGYIAA